MTAHVGVRVACSMLLGVPEWVVRTPLSPLTPKPCATPNLAWVSLHQATCKW